MKLKILIQAGVALALISAVGSGYYMWQPEIAVRDNRPLTFSAESINRGARIVQLGDCAVCHTSAKGKPMAGGLPLVTPFGTLFSTNLTPDWNTGIGSWTEEAFVRAMRRGIARDGHLLYPAFPYVHYTKMHPLDVSDAYAYLMSGDAVVAVAPNNDMMFPMNFRPLVAFWNLLFLHGGQAESDVAQSEELSKGRYLVEGLGHCSSCHTPLNLIGGEKTAKHFGGGVVDGWDAPALDQLANAAIPWSKEQLVDYLRGTVATEHGAAAGPMLPVSMNLAEVPLGDVQAMATYLMSLQRPNLAKISSVNASAITASELKGATLFAGACAGCHADAAPMRILGQRPELKLGSALNADSPRNTILTILNGIPFTGTGASHYMPAFANSFTNSDIVDLVAFLRSQGRTPQPWPELDETVSTLRTETPSR